MNENRITVACEHFGKYIPKLRMDYFRDLLKDAPDDCLDSLMAIPMKKPVATLLFSIFLGGLGVDRFYLGDNKMGGWKLALSLFCAIGIRIIDLMVSAMEVPGLSVVVSLLSLGLGIWRTVWGWFDIFVLYRRAKESNYIRLIECIQREKATKKKAEAPKIRESVLNKEEQ